MKVSVYSTAWSIVSKSFDYRGALDNWFTFSDEVSIAVPNSDTDNSAALIATYAQERGYNVIITRTDFALDGSDPFAYGKTENAALQACTGDLLIQQNGDERMRVTRQRLEELHAYLCSYPDIKSLFVPTIDLYGSSNRYVVPIKGKWYIHGRGLKRGAVQFGLKADGRPDYNKTSTDELLTLDGNLASTMPLLRDGSIESLRHYVAQGYPLVYHLGFLDLASRADRAKWWGQFWVNATGGDSNSHITDVAELEKRHTFEHGLPLWPTKTYDDLTTQDFKDTEWPKP